MWLWGFHVTSAPGADGWSFFLGTVQGDARNALTRSTSELVQLVLAYLIVRMDQLYRCPDGAEVLQPRSNLGVFGISASAAMNSILSATIRTPLKLIHHASVRACVFRERKGATLTQAISGIHRFYREPLTVVLSFLPRPLGVEIPSGPLLTTSFRIVRRCGAMIC